MCYNLVKTAFLCATVFLVKTNAFNGRNLYICLRNQQLKREMKQLYIMLLLLLLGCTVQAREVVNLNRDWKFFPDSETTSDGARQINLPHIWNDDALGGRLDYLRGSCNYMRNFDVPQKWQDKRIFLRFNGANAVASVFVNGRYVGEHRGGYTAFAFEITEFVTVGSRNNLRVVVNNSPRLDVLPIAGNINSYGGLFRDVELVVTNGVAFSHVMPGANGVVIKQNKVSAERVEATAEVNISGTKDMTVQANIIVRSQAGDTVSTANARVRLAGSTVASAKIPFTIDNPRLWNGTTDPYLYEITATITDSGRVMDSFDLKTGFRTVAVKDGQFLLNGEPYLLRGVTVHQDRAMVGTAITDYQVIEDFVMITEMGANAIRVANVLHHDKLFELCDRIGLIVWCDMPFIGQAYLTDKAFVPSQEFRDNCELQFREILNEKFNHPSIVMWGVFSELATRGDDPSDLIRRMNRFIKNEDASRMTVALSNQDGDINLITDLVVWNQQLGWSEGMPSDIKIWLQQLRAGWSHLSSGLSYSAGGSIYHQEEGVNNRPVAASNWHPERWQTYFHEQYYRHTNDSGILWGIFVGNMFDYGAAGYRWGDGNGVFDHGLVTFDRKYRKDAFYFYKANWNTESPFVQIAEKRLYQRKNLTQNIKVFTNMTEAELFVNGTSAGTRKPASGIATWQNVELTQGLNHIEVRSGYQSDSAIIDIKN